MSLHIIELVGPITLRYNFDAFTEKLGTLDKTDQLCFDFSRVGFVNPEALIVLVTASKLAFEKIQRPVLWDKLKPDVYSYLERVNIPSVRFVQLKKPKEAKKFYRSVRPSNNLVEFSIIKGWKEVGDAISKTRGVLNRWFPNKSIRYRQNLSTLVKETVENSIDHSGEHTNEGVCYYAVQKYEQQNGKVEIHIAVGDIGVGMLASLRRVHPETKDDMDAILGALIHGKSGRPSGRGGLGYVTIKEALANLNGSLTIRSGKAIVLYDSHHDSPRIYRQNPNYPGTQIIFRCGG